MTSTSTSPSESAQQDHKPPNTTLKHRKAHVPKDIFDSLPTAPDLQVQPSSESDSFLSKFIFGPLTFLTYLLSLTLTSRHHDALRAHERSSSTSTPGGWWQPPAEPAQSSATGTWHTTSSNNASAPVGSGWVVRKKHRAVTKMEMGDAWALRPLVLLALGVVLVGIAGGAVAVGWVGWRRWGR